MTGPRLADGATVYPGAKIVNANRLVMGEHSTIDDFVFFNAGEGASIGRYVHVAAHVSVIGGGRLEIGDYAVVGTGARILNGTDTYEDGARMSTHLPDEYRRVRRGLVLIERDAFIGANAVVMPGVRIGEGAVAGAGAVVTADLDSWTVYVGSPARPLKVRPRPDRSGP